MIWPWILLAVVILILVGLLYLYFKLDDLLAWLVCWGISKTPKKFKWEVGKVCLRPGRNDTWSTLSMKNWSWLEPDGFEEEGASQNYLLQIDDLTLTLLLGSLWGARKHKSIVVKELRVAGMRFRTRRNYRGSLNLWECLQLPEPDENVNVQVIMNQARWHGGMQEDEDESEQKLVVAPLSAISTEATRKAAHFWKTDWGNQQEWELQKQKARGSILQKIRDSLTPSDEPASNPETPMDTPEDTPEEAGADSQRSPLLDQDGYHEYPIGDPRRRPRWGVQVRFDIEQLIIKDAELAILDLLQLRAHRSHHDLELDDMATIPVPKLVISRERLERGDGRRKGLADRGMPADGVRGVYLGEMIWVIIAEAVPVIIRRSTGKLFLTAMAAAGYAITDVAKGAAAAVVTRAIYMTNRSSKLLQTISDRGRASLNLAVEREEDEWWNDPDAGCWVQLHLISGRQMTWNEKSVNCFVVVAVQEPPEKLAAQGEVLAKAKSNLRMWTMRPHWDEMFDHLGPIRSRHALILIDAYHRSSTEVMKPFTGMEPEDSDHMGSVRLTVEDFLIEDKVIAEGGAVVGWFPLQPTSGDVPSSGQIKIGVKIFRSDLLSDEEKSKNATVVSGISRSTSNYVVLPSDKK